MEDAEVLILIAPNATKLDSIVTSLHNFPVEMLHEPTSNEQVSRSLMSNQVVGRRRKLDVFLWEALCPPQKLLPEASDVCEDLRSELERYKKKHSKSEKKVKANQTDIERLQEELAQATDRNSNMQLEFEQFSQDVHELQSQYVKLLESNQRILWDYLPQHDGSIENIPPINHSINESVTEIGEYTIHATIGEGQYASVYACSRTNSTSCCPSLSPTTDAIQPQLAVKAIDKSKLNDIVALFRVHSEISALKDPNLRHPSILSLKDIIHTTKFIYLVTERGGKDLFDFFGPHVDGVSEATALRITSKIVEAVRHLHCNDYCHRDLKPENILFTQDNNMVKLVDFGLCAKVGTNPLRDFCGSPGFFAPEMLLNESYDGQKADVWSTGCILLELILGNVFFLKTWMTAYQLDVLGDHKHFHKLLQSNLASMEMTLQTNETYSTNVKSLLLAMLCEDAKERPTIYEVAQHPWFETLNPRKSLKQPREKLKAAMSMSDVIDNTHTTPHPPTMSSGISPTRPLSAQKSPGDKLILPSIKNSPEKHIQPR